MSSRRNISTDIAVVLCLTLLSPQAKACTRAFPTYTVKSEFRVLVTDRGKPLEGIEVEISREIEKPEFHSETVVWKRTNAKGEIVVQHLPAGNYFIVTRHARIEGEDAAQLKVSDSVDAESEVTLHWPGHMIFTLNKIGGTLKVERDPAHPFENSNPLVSASVLLTDAASGQQIGATVSDDQGNFEFAPSPAPSLYILRISERGLENKDQDTLIQGDIFVEVDAKSSVRKLPRVNLIMMDCGLSGWTDKEHLLIF